MVLICVILKKLKILKNKNIRIRKVYRGEIMYCSGCRYYDTVSCSIKNEMMLLDRKYPIPTLCYKDMKRWDHGISRFVYHAL